MAKYRNVKTVVDNITFASKREAARYQELKILERSGEIVDLTLQPEYVLGVNSVKICTYRADFSYRNREGLRVVEDVKGVKTPVYKLKKKLMLAIYGIDIREI